MSDYDVHWLPPDAGETARVWRALEARHPAGTVASWTWTSTWLRHFGDVVAPRVAVVTRRGEPVAVALLVTTVRRRGGVPLRVTHLGTRGEPRPHVFAQHQRLLGDPAHRAGATAALLRAVGRLGWDELRAEGFVADHAGGLAAVRPGARVVAHEARTFALRDDVQAGLGPSTRKVVRRSLRRAAPLRVTRPTSRRATDDLLREIAALNRERWARPGVPDALGGRVLAFHRDLAARLADEERLLLVGVTDAFGTVGGLYGFDDVDGRVLAYAIGRRAIQERWSAGQVTEVLAMQAARDAGWTTWCHGSGTTEQKLRLSDGQELLCDLRWRRRLGHLLDAGVAARTVVTRG